MEERKECITNYQEPFPETIGNNCIFLIPEQFGGDETNRPTFCLLRGFDYPEKGCIWRKTKMELITMMRVERMKR